MAILLDTERNWRARVLVAGMYLLLTAGGLTMVYPFLLMLSGSVKSDIDVYDFDVIPRYWHDDAVLYRKTVEMRCNESVALYAVQYRDGRTLDFRELRPPPESPAALLDDWRDFLAQPLPPGWYYLAASWSSVNRNLPPQRRAFRQYLQSLCGGDIEKYRRRFSAGATGWFFVYAPNERLAERAYRRPDQPLAAAFYDYKESVDLEWRLPVSCDGEYAAWLEKVNPRYGGSIKAYNRENDTSHAAFDEIILPERAPAAEPARTDWENFIRESLNPQFVFVDDDARPAWTAFLRERHDGDLARLNRLHGRESGASDGTVPYADFDEVPFPVERLIATPPALEYAAFVQTAAPLASLRVDSPELRWRAFLADKYGSPLRAAAAHGLSPERADRQAMPLAAADWKQVLERGGELRRHFLTSNFRAVFEYILLYGRGVANTVIYCSLAILAAMTVNPLAAYALSRFPLRGLWKILLFLLATMAFPPQVTMIPNFLLLKELGLLNTFAALILPTMANGYSIFLLKGFFDSLPKELYEAADIEGASEWCKFWTVTMSLSKPILAVVALGAFNAAYANFMMALLLCQDPDMWTLMVRLYRLQQWASPGVVFAALLVAAIPTLLVFVFCQNLILRGIVVPSEK